MEEQGKGPSFEGLLRRAMEEPGRISEAYTAFHQYSMGNQLAAFFECHARGIPIGPLATYKAWVAKGRNVRKGEKALTLCMPITLVRERESESGEKEKVTFSRFVWRKNWFTVHQTDGVEYQVPEIPEWNKATALATLKVEEELFQHADGNCQGYAKTGRIAVSPVAAFPMKTTFHELAHVVLGHCADGTLSNSDHTPRDIREVEAEGVAFILTATLNLPGMAESRGYLQLWAHGQAITERSAQRIMSAASAILKAGKAGV